MPLSSLLATQRISRGAAAGVLVLATGGLFLLHAGKSSAGDSPAGPGVTTYLASVSADPPVGNGPTSVLFSGPHVRGSLALSGARVLAGRDQPLYADVTLTADRDGAEHTPLALVVVLDTSGSMEGEKLREAKSAVRGLVREMREDDEVAFVRYSDTAELVQPLMPVREVRERLLARVDALSADGGTAIPLGLAAGLQALDGELGGRVRRVVLVSDGLDSSRPQSERLARVNFDKGITISSMGIGLDFNEGYMGGVARVGHGNFGFVNDEPTLASFLKRELDETATTTADNTVVHLHMPDGVRFVKATGADAETHGRDVDLKVGALFTNEAKRVLVEMSTDMTAGARADLNGSVTWRSVGAGVADATIPQLEVLATTDAAAVTGAANETVLARAASVIASERQVAAAEAYADGDAQKANALIQKNVAALGTAAARAPAAVASALVAQSASYEGTMSAFQHASPQSAKGRWAAKSAAAANMANSGEKAF